MPSCLPMPTGFRTIRWCSLDPCVWYHACSLGSIFWTSRPDGRSRPDRQPRPRWRSGRRSKWTERAINIWNKISTTYPITWWGYECLLSFRQTVTLLLISSKERTSLDKSWLPSICWRVQTWDVIHWSSGTQPSLTRPSIMASAWTFPTSVETSTSPSFSQV